MPIGQLGVVKQFMQDTQQMWAVLLGMFVQFALGEKNSIKVGVTILISSVFVALYLVPIAVDLAKIKTDSNIAIAMYAFSSLLSIEIMAITMKILPKAAEDKMAKFLGVKNANAESEK